MLASCEQAAAELADRCDHAFVLLLVWQHVSEVADPALHAGQIFLELALRLSRASAWKSERDASRVQGKEVIVTRRFQKYEIAIFDEVGDLHAKQAGIKSQRPLDIADHDICMKNAFAYHGILLTRRPRQCAFHR